jgi:hypothetical protein
MQTLLNDSNTHTWSHADEKLYGGSRIKINKKNLTKKILRVTFTDTWWVLVHKKLV